MLDFAKHVLELFTGRNYIGCRIDIGCGINIDTGYVFANNWRATRKSVADMAGHIKEEMGNKIYTTVVFHLLDILLFRPK